MKYFGELQKTSTNKIKDIDQIFFLRKFRVEIVRLFKNSCVIV